MKGNVLKWIGGKAELAPFIIQKMPPHKAYIEVFGGALNVFLQKPLVQLNLVNDINHNLINLYKTILNETHKETLKQLLKNITYSRELYNFFYGLYNTPDWKYTGTILKSLIFIYLNRTSFNGQFQSYARRDDSSILYELDEIIEQMHRKFHAGRTVIENLHFKDLLSKPQYNNSQVLIYLDPPYWVTTQAVGSAYYEHKMETFEHAELEKLLREKYPKAKIIISYDDVPEVRKLYSDKFWTIINTPNVHQSSGSLQKEQIFKSELVIANFDVANQNSLFEGGKNE